MSFPICDTKQCARRILHSENMEALHLGPSQISSYVSLYWAGPDLYPL